MQHEWWCILLTTELQDLKFKVINGYIKFKTNLPIWNSVSEKKEKEYSVDSNITNSQWEIIQFTFYLKGPHTLKS